MFSCDLISTVSTPLWGHYFVATIPTVVFVAVTDSHVVAVTEVRTEVDSVLYIAVDVLY